MPKKVLLSERIRDCCPEKGKKGMSEGKLWEGEVVAGNSAAIPPASAEAASILFPFQLLLTILPCAGESIYVAAQSARLGGYPAIK